MEDMKDEFNPFSLAGKKVIVTGASSGIGRQCAIDISRIGGTVALIGRNEERLQETLEMLAGDGHLSYPVDLTDFDRIQDCVRAIVGKMGKIDGMVHCAGISTTLPFKYMSIDKMAHFFETNVYSALALSREAVGKKYMNDGGSVIFLSSVMGEVGEVGKSLYGMTKGALVSAVRSLACEYAKRRIRFNCISPGAILTPINENLPHMKDPDKRELLEEKHLLGLGAVTDVSNSCIFLLSDASRWITGSNLVVDGGYTVR